MCENMDRLIHTIHSLLSDDEIDDEKEIYVVRRHIRSIKTEYSQWIHQLLHNNRLMCVHNEFLARQN